MGCSSSSASGWTAASCSGLFRLCLDFGSGFFRLPLHSGGRLLGQLLCLRLDGGGSRLHLHLRHGCQSPAFPPTPAPLRGSASSPENQFSGAFATLQRSPFQRIGLHTQLGAGFRGASSTVLPVASGYGSIGLSPPFFSVPAFGQRNGALVLVPLQAFPAGGHTPDGACSSRWRRFVFLNFAGLFVLDLDRGALDAAALFLAAGSDTRQPPGPSSYRVIDLAHHQALHGGDDIGDHVVQGECAGHG